MNDDIGRDEPEPEPYVPTVLEAELFPDDVAAWAASVTPGSAVVKALAVLDPRRMSHAGRVDALAALDKQVAWSQALQDRFLAIMAEYPTVRTPAGDLDKEWVRDEVACALRLSPGHAANRLQVAKELTGRLPDTLDLQERGEITSHHARSLAEATMTLAQVTASKVETAVLPKAQDQALASFRRCVKRNLLKYAPQTAEQAHEKGMAERRVVRMPSEAGMSGIWILLSDAGATTFMTAIDALARRVTSDDPRTSDQRRADAAVQLAIDTLHGTSSGELPREHGMRPTVNVCVALSTLLGLDEQPGELAGSGPIPASVARRLAADPTGTWRRLVTDPIGKLVDYGRTTYRPPKDLADHVIARDRTCRFPHCQRPACRCELDHEKPWEHKGETNEPNLLSICCRHHHLKHDGGWRPRCLGDGSIEWTSPTAHTYVDPPAAYPIDRTRELGEPTDQGEPSETDPDPPF
ncbi:MAG: hypothetical protein JWP07_2448 [Pseudonocardiales bacterium]|nr:hypothetical protein [Pseudonocardiales bacterium]